MKTSTGRREFVRLALVAICAMVLIVLLATVHVSAAPKASLAAPDAVAAI